MNPAPSTLLGNENEKLFPLPKPPIESVPPWNGEKGEARPAPPPVWTRYIDSRLKQFCSR